MLQITDNRSGALDISRSKSVSKTCNGANWRPGPVVGETRSSDSGSSPVRALASRSLGSQVLNFAVVATVFPIILLGELPDKTMFACVFMAAHRRAGPVWIGAAIAFSLQVALAVLVGVALFRFLPHVLVEAVVAVAFFSGAVYMFVVRNKKGEDQADDQVFRASNIHTVVAAGGVVFLAEWGDLTQILTVGLAARYHSPLSVSAGALAALCTAAFVAVKAGARLPKIVPLRVLRLATSVVLTALGGYAVSSAL